MQLDYVARTGSYILWVPRGTHDPRTIMEEHGLDFSATASTPDKACLFTQEPYAAVSFWDYATPAARDNLLRLRTEIEASWRKESNAHILVPPDEELAPFQKAGVEYALRRNNTLIGDVPGLGKTPMAIAIANEMSARRVLVLCPANIRLQWIKQIRRWSTMSYPFVAYPILNGKHGVHPSANWTVTSYDLARTEAIGKALARGEYDLLILDEGHYLKEIDSQRTRAVFGGGLEPKFEALASRAERIVTLTGTPLPNRPREAYTQARGLCWDAIDFVSEDGFRTRFNPSMKRETADGKIFIDERVGRAGELQARLRSNFMVRREKYGPDGVGYQLGMVNVPQFDIIHMEETRAVRAALQAEALLDIDPENLEGADASALGHIAVVRRQMGTALAPEVAGYVSMLLDGGEEKIVVFAHHVDVLNILEKSLQRFGVTRIDGSDGAVRKQKKVDDWIADPRKNVLVGNMISMGTGTDGLQAVVRRAVFAEPDWVMGTNQQAFDRIDRPGAMDGVAMGDFCVAPGSFSERVLASALRKGREVHKALDRRM